METISGEHILKKRTGLARRMLRLAALGSTIVFALALLGYVVRDRARWLALLIYLPMVIVEAKSGRFGQDHREGLFWYALLAALRHGTPPAAVIGWSAWDGTGWAQAVTEGMLRASAQRSVDALERLGDLARGRTPVRTPGRGCTWCPERTTCAVAATPEDDDDGW